MKRALCILLCLMLVLLPAVSQGATLHSGSTGQSVIRLQQRLREFSLLTGKADGVYGQQTQNAVRQAQRLLSLFGYNVPENGIADELTLELIFSAEAEDALNTLYLGSKGERVKAAQNRLIDLNMMDAPADGSFGNATAEAVLRFQQKMMELGLVWNWQDGVLDPETHEILFSDLSVYNFPAPVCFDTNQPLNLMPEHLYGDACIVIDAPSGQVLFEHNAHQRMYPASTTKIMTLLLALSHSNLQDMVTIPQSAANVPVDSSLVPVYPGEQMSMEALLHGLMIRSGNDAANAVAELCLGDVATFVDAMNQKALDLGLTNTHFVNPHGYHDENHYSTAYDLAAIARAGLTDPTFCKIVTCLSYPMPATSRRDVLTLTCTHEIFDPASEYHIPYAAGVKSGYTSLAGFCYVGAAQANGHTLIAVVLHAPTRNRAWQDLQKLFSYGFAALE